MFFQASYECSNPTIILFDNCKILKCNTEEAIQALHLIIHKMKLSRLKFTDLQTIGATCNLDGVLPTNMLLALETLSSCFSIFLSGAELTPLSGFPHRLPLIII